MSSSIGYTSGAIYKRHQGINYRSGTKFKRFGGFGLIQQRNMGQMNRQASNNYRSAFSTVGYIALDANLVQSQGLSELAANKVLARVKEQMLALADSASSLSFANGGSGGIGDTGTKVDQTA